MMYPKLYPSLYPSNDHDGERYGLIRLWESVSTSLIVGDTVYKGTAFEVPELHRVIHTVEITGLEPDTEYSFNLPNGEITALYTTLKDDPRTSVVVHWQTKTPFINRPATYQDTGYKFRTFPNSLNDRSVTMISGGDIFQHGQIAKLRSAFDVITNRKPDVFVIAGDIAYADNVWDNRGQWHTFWDEWLQRIDPNEPIIPMVVGIGNHEIGNGVEITHQRGERFNFEEKRLGNNTWFAAQFAFPQNGAYGVIDAGDYLSLVMLDSEHASPYNTQYAVQTVWLGNTLNARKNVKHVIPFTHIPSFPATRSYSSTVSGRMRDNWIPLYEAHGGVKVVFEHHDHVYKRTVPIKTVDGEPAEHPDGIRFLGDGAMGVVIRDAWNPNTTWYLEDVKATRYVQAESGVSDPMDGQPGYDTTVDEAWHVYETVFESDKRTINTLNILGDGNGTVYHTLVQEVDHV